MDMEQQEFIRAVARNARFDAAEIEKKIKSHGIEGVVEEVILPLVHPTGASHISDSFMQLMSEGGEYISENSPQSYEVLTKIALGRLINGAVELKKPLVVELPLKYQAYSSANDQPAPMSQYCWNFLIDNAELMLKNSNVSKYAEQVIFGLVECTHPYYKGKYQWGDEEINTPKEVAFNRLQGLLMRVWYDQTFAHLNDDNWPAYSDMLKAQAERVDWNKFFQQLNISWKPLFWVRRMVQNSILK